MTGRNTIYVSIILVILAFGIFIRIHPTAAFTQTGYDEGVYSRYLGDLWQKGGLAHYRELIQDYQATQDTIREPQVHPLRMVFLVSSYGWMWVFHHDPAGTSQEIVVTHALSALHAVATIASILHLLVAGIFAWRAGGRAALPGVLVLMACAPLQICLAQRALVDGMYAFWAVLCFWLLWENLRAPNNWKWLTAYTVSLFLFVMTKEYSAFVVFAFCGIFLVNRWLDIGTVTPRLLAATVAGPALAVLVLVCFAGGVGAFIHFYLNFIQRSQKLNYAIQTQDGPWSRYLLDFLIISPVVVLLAVGRAFQISLKNRADVFCAVFWLFCYIPMASATYGMSLRFAAFWDLPMCWLAFSQLSLIAEKISLRRKTFVLAVATLLVCCVELQGYQRIFMVKMGVESVYDPVTPLLFHAVKMLYFN